MSRAQGRAIAFLAWVALFIAFAITSAVLLMSGNVPGAAGVWAFFFLVVAFSLMIKLLPDDGRARAGSYTPTTRPPPPGTMVPPDKLASGDEVRLPAPTGEDYRRQGHKEERQATLAELACMSYSRLAQDAISGRGRAGSPSRAPSEVEISFAGGVLASVIRQLSKERNNA